MQCVLELSAGEADVKSFLVNGIIRAELDDNGVASRVDLLRRLSGRTKPQLFCALSQSTAVTNTCACSILGQSRVTEPVSRTRLRCVQLLLIKTFVAAESQDIIYADDYFQMLQTQYLFLS